jgi:hypothetical protein
MARFFGWCKLRTCVDAWLWREVRQRARSKTCMQMHRDRIQREPQRREIQAIYWHEIHSPSRPMRSIPPVSTIDNSCGNTL